MLLAQMVKGPLAVQERRVWSLGWEGPQRKEWLPTPVFSTGEFHEEPVGLQSVGLQRVPRLSDSHFHLENPSQEDGS